MNIDAWAVDWLNGQAASHSVLRTMTTWTAKNMAFVLLVTLVAGGLVALAADIRKHRDMRWQIAEAAAISCLALVIGLAVNQVIGSAWFRTRPSDALPGIQLLAAASTDPSFPSDHAAASFAIALGICLALPRLGLLLLGEAVLLCVSRVAVGLHYPGDIVAGVFVALASVAVAEAIVGLARPFLLQSVRRFGPTRLQIRESALPRLFSVGALRIAAILAATLGMPILIEGAADPIRFDREWIELLALGTIVAALACMAVALVKTTSPSRGHQMKTNSTP